MKGYQGARYKSYPSLQEAKAEYKQGYQSPKSSGQVKRSTTTTSPIEESVSVDAGTHGNPGPVEYQGVYTKDGKLLFKKEAYPLGTNNMAEFLAIVHAFKFLHNNKMNVPVYTDSQTAMGWVKAKKAKATLVRNEKSVAIWDDVQEAEQWLRDHNPSFTLLKWDTKAWGEIKADYGRK
ncbi:ribonuclease HI-related protein 3 [Geomicrobium sp. JCM 19039]|nr:ribonuclease HI-related protein 3 [Geomicrobium sp. JCM 19039]